MKLLVTGRGGRAGSWKVRGEQLGEALGATVRPVASATDIKQVDLTIAIKRIPEALADVLRRARTKWVYDVVDFYPQPLCTAWSKDYGIKWVRRQIKKLKPDGIIWPNERMAADCAIDLPGLVLPHHYRPGLVHFPVKPRVMTVGYEGSERYLGEWRKTIERQCLQRDWTFSVNDRPVSHLDVVLGVRCRSFSGYVQHHWKSNVKLANAHGAGVPFIGVPECGYLENATGREIFVESPKDLADAFDAVSPYETRLMTRQAFLERRYSVSDAARDLLGFCERVVNGG